RKLVPFLRNRSPASVRRSWHAATSHRPLAWLVSRLPVRKARKRLPQVAISTRDLVGMDVKMLRQLGDGSVALDGGQSLLRLTWGGSGQGGRIRVTSADLRYPRSDTSGPKL